MEKFSLRNLLGRKSQGDTSSTRWKEPPPGTTVLIIDDSKTIVSLLKRMLQRYGYDTLHAYDAETGIALALHHQPSIMLLDIVLPGMDGFRAVRLLRRDSRTAHLPIIMISGNPQAAQQFWVQKIGADDFMAKPFTEADVMEKVEKALESRRSDTEETQQN